DRRAVDTLCFDTVHLEDLLEPLDVVLGFAEMRFEPLLETRIRRFFDHVGQSLHDLLFGVVDVAQLVHEQVIECFNVFAKKAHGSSLTLVDFSRATLLDLSMRAYNHGSWNADGSLAALAVRVAARVQGRYMRNK